MTDKPDVVIIGAGVMGCGAAYWLSKAGCKALLIEKESLGYGASGMTAGMMGFDIEGAPDEPLVQLTLASLKLHKELAETLPEESGIDIGYRENPIIYPAFSESDVERLKSRSAKLNRQVTSVQWLEGQPLWELEPRLNREALGGLVARQAQVLAYRFVLALAQVAEEQGMKMRNGEAVGLETYGGRVSGVRLKSGEFVPAETVVLAMGPWTQYAAAWVGLEIPIYPVRGQLLELQVPDPQLNASLFLGEKYLVYKADGITFAGTTKEYDSGFADNTTAEAAESIMEAALRLAPSMEEAKLLNHVAGLRPASEDGLPLIGPIPGWEGVYMLSGHFSTGIKLSAMSTRIIADLITEGRSSLPIKSFDPGRFGKTE